MAWKQPQGATCSLFLRKCLKCRSSERRCLVNNNLNMLHDLLQTEITNQSMYNKYMMDIQNPEIRQMFMQMRDGKMQQVTQLQQEIKNFMRS
ncbi:DUF2383 domain-containing protein [Ethanoligenens harbinense]|nr:hypothetical protein CXQ68_08680 [Ethanoligenens harbinense YUAN-3]AYF38949.1 hypothetical protein CXP51_08550 [Ethanoligenens harbinense]AYF41701.1 hypothetical protein CN246_08700 [Ethanoligenens harbinense]QCN92531.1 DUF2383 domain-containing protein [Ethanoligenens harbinense]